MSSADRNPQYTGVKRCIWELLDRWWGRKQEDETPQGMSTSAFSFADLATGSGEVVEACLLWQEQRWSTPQDSPSLRTVVRPPGKFSHQSRPDIQFIATDPYTSEAYESRIKQSCLSLSFRDIADGQLPGGDRVYEVVFISFALHLVGDSGELWALLIALSQRGKWLVIIAPHKKPEVGRHHALLSEPDED